MQVSEQRSVNFEGNVLNRVYSSIVAGDSRSLAFEFYFFQIVFDVKEVKEHFFFFFGEFLRKRSQYVRIYSSVVVVN